MPLNNGEKKYIVAKGEVFTLTYSLVDNLWRAEDGTIFALRDDKASVDGVDRCGVWFFSLPEHHPLTASCIPHEMAYSSPSFQLFHTRKEADEMLFNLIKQNKKYKWLAWPFYFLARTFGGWFWEGKR